MNEQELRSLVREAIARHLGGAVPEALPGPPTMVVRQHVSHALLLLPDGADADGPCLIEPAVPCCHCGFCKSYGH